MKARAASSRRSTIENIARVLAPTPSRVSPAATKSRDVTTLIFLIIFENT